MAPIKASSFNIKLTKDENSQWNRLATLEFQASRYPCHITLHTLGLRESWTYLCERGSLTELFAVEKKSYRVLTYEFLSTLEVEMNGTDVYAITFRLRNEPYTLSIDEFNAMFDFYPSDVGIIEEPKEFNIIEFWHAITIPREGHRHSSATAKINAVRNPVFRYMLKAFAYLPFGRHEAGSAQNEDLFILWCILRGQPVNMGHYIIKYLERQATKVKKHICCGGLITHLAEVLQVNFSGYEADKGPTSINFAVLKQTRMINVNNMAQGYLLQDQSDHFPIPNPTLSAVAGWEFQTNWKMDTTEHQRIVRDNPPGPWGPTNLHPFRAGNTEIPTLPQEPSHAMAIVVPYAQRGGHTEDDGEGSSRGPRRKRIFNVEQAFDSVNQRLDAMEISANERYESQRHAIMELRDEQNAYWATYQANRQHDLQWHKRMENFISHYPHPMS